ncbi:MAG: tetratricopeptide repeat protein [Proteobacteria bacterium]|nr:tetratricopeptide repeat protein [Pseudomonadota bacterium]
MKKKFIIKMPLLMMIMLLVACASPEQKKNRFFDKGTKLFEQEDYIKAKIEFKNAIQIDPKFSEAYYMLGKISLKDSNFKQAFANYSKAVELKPHNLNAQYELGRLFLAVHAIEKAEEKVKVILDTDPKNIDGLVLQSSVLLAQKEFDEAYALLDKLIRSHISRPEIYLMLARISSEKKDDERSIEKLLKEGISHHPKDIGLHRALIQFYIQAKDNEKTVETFRRMIAIDPENVDYKMALAELYWKNKDNQQAINVLNQIIQADRENEDNYLKVAKFYFDRQQPELSAETISNGLKINKSSHTLKLALSDVYSALNETEKSIPLLNEVIDENKDPSHPGTVAAKIAFSRHRLDANDQDGALQYINDVLKDNPNNTEALYIKGNILLNKKDGLNAIMAFRTIIDAHPEEMNGYLRLAQAHYINGEKPLAIDTLKNAIKINPGAREISQALVGLLMEANESEAALQQMTTMVNNNPDDMRFRSDLADFYVYAKNLSKAEEENQIILERMPDNPFPYLKLSQLYAKQGKLEEAEKLLESGFAKIPDSRDIMARLVQVLISRNKLGPALEICRKQIKMNEKDALAYNLSGRVYEIQKKYDDAEHAYLKAVEYKPMWLAPHNNLARIYLVQGKTKDAEERLISAIQVNPKNNGAFILLANIYEKSGEYPKAKNTYEKALAENSELWLAANNLAFLLTEHPEADSDFEKALKLAKQAYQKQPENPTVLDTIGWAYYKLNNLTQADNYLTKALSTDPENQAINYHMAMILIKQGKLNDAREKLETALGEKSHFEGRKQAEDALIKLHQTVAS